MNSSLKTQLQALQNTFLDKNTLESLLKDFPFEEILSLFLQSEINKDKENIKLLRNVLNGLSLNPSFSGLFLFNQDPNHQEKMQKLLKSDNSETRVLLTNALSLNADEIREKMLYYSENNKELFFSNLNVIFFQLSDPEAEIGLKILRLFLTIADDSIKKQETVFFLTKEALKYIENGLFNQRDVVRIRVMDLIVSLSIKEQHVFIALSDLLEKSFEIYKSGDILVKLSAVEVLAKLGDCKWTSEFLTSHEFFNSLLKEAFDNNSEYYIQKYLILLVSKMIGNNSLKFEFNLKKNMAIFLKNSFLSNSSEENEGGLEIIGNLLSKDIGLEFLLKDRFLLKEYLKFYRSVNSNLKKKFLNSLAKAFEYDEFKNFKILRNLFSLLGDVTGKLVEIIEMGSDIVNEEYLKGAMNWLFTVLYSPFADFEVEALLVLKEIIKYEFGMKELAKQQKAIEYLLHNITKTKEIFDEKFAIRRFLNENFKAKSYTDPIIKEFSLKYLEGFEMQNKGSSMVYYKTEAND